MAGAQGHMTVRRKPKDGVNGNPGDPGAIIRVSCWETGKAYCNGTYQDGVKYIDICTNMSMALVTDSNFAAYQCISDHTSSSSIPLGTSGVWSKLNSLRPIVTAFILAQKIQAKFIDVDSLSADEAFITSLFAQSIEADNLTLLEGCTIGGVKVLSNGIEVDLPDVDGAIRITESIGLYATFKNKTAAVGGCNGAAIQAFGDSGYGFCPSSETYAALVASTRSEGYAFMSNSGLFAGFRPTVVFVDTQYAYFNTAGVNVTTLSSYYDHVIIARYSSGPQYIYLPSYPQLGAWYRIVNDYSRGSNTLSINGNGKTIEQSGGKLTTLTVSKRCVIDFHWNGEYWTTVVSAS